MRVYRKCGSIAGSMSGHSLRDAAAGEKGAGRATTHSVHTTNGADM
eukprot:SAG22_NODE_20946_length_261_cov_0.858025_1_plen_45_part_10